ncbi:type IX secretion system PorP/SprF family membrane protein [Algoriphagus ratkowskyi]|uniref:Type IX secretion system PorP/SprF family membrane protein n=2 Tax=Algoriphagus ratkowskyi TaxID=57028 RepID=A0A2W7TBB1_9BACT|nr:type IX secretion system membrane protein PorP/SprF [Algoriphagus ratkowskyi]PZX60492.1 type IX secretion system PorP/SprF family membrane protein [Algoriphagus ratkowskyi]TXD78295.1 type IX secretion system membrane protein PorP/SprF [Algoriphagus ratkowskyi]
MMRRYFVFVFLLLSASQAFSQDVQYSQFYANPFYLNPALAGSTGLTRVGVNFRNQWPALDQSFVAYSAYADHFSEKYNSGLGIIVSGARESFNQSRTDEIGLVYSYRLQLGEKRFLHVGTQGSLISRDVLFDQLILGTQLDIDKGVIIGEPGIGFSGDSKLRAIDMNAGLLYYEDKFWFGFSAFHLLKPQISYLELNSNRLPIKYSVQGGVRFNLAPGNINDYFNNTDQERSLAFAFNYKTQGVFDQLDVGAEFYFEPLILGLWYRGLPTKYNLPNNESLIGLIGIELDAGLDFGYSFDYSISKLGQQVSGGAHEVSVRYVFSSQNPREKHYPALPTFRY